MDHEVATMAANYGNTSDVCEIKSALFLEIFDVTMHKDANVTGTQSQKWAGSATRETFATAPEQSQGNFTVRRIESRLNLNLTYKARAQGLSLLCPKITFAMCIF